MKWYPKTKLGKISFWGTVAGIILMYSLYWAAMIGELRIPIPLGLAGIVLMLIFGTISVILIIRNKDRAILLFLSALLGLFAWFMIIGEFLFPH